MHEQLGVQSQEKQSYIREERQVSSMEKGKRWHSTHLIFPRILYFSLTSLLNVSISPAVRILQDFPIRTSLLMPHLSSEQVSLLDQSPVSTTCQSHVQPHTPHTCDEQLVWRAHYFPLPTLSCPVTTLENSSTFIPIGPLDQPKL